MEDITEALWGTRVSSGTVSRLNQRIYEQIDAWRRRPITGSYPSVSLDGVILQRSWGGEVRHVSVLLAIGVGSDGYRHILGVAEGEKEDLEGWRGFLRHRKNRGLAGVQRLISDACLGLVEAAAECYPKARWQHCVVHWYRNVCAHVPRGQRDVVARLLKAIHAQEDRQAALKAKAVAAKLTAMKLRTAAALVRHRHADAHLRRVSEHTLAADPDQQPAGTDQPRSATSYAGRGGLPRRPIRRDAGRGAAPSHRGNPMGYKALPHHRAIADTKTSTTSCVETQTEAAPIRKCERFWTQPCLAQIARIEPELKPAVLPSTHSEQPT